MDLALEITILVVTWLVACFGVIPSRAESDGQQGDNRKGFTRMLHGKACVVVPLLTLALVLGIWKAVHDANSEEELIQRAQQADNLTLTLLGDVPQLEYEWESNYIRLVKKVTNRGPVTGVLTIRSRDATLTDVIVEAVMSTDDRVARYPYAVDALGIAIAKRTRLTLRPDETIRVDLMGEFIEKGFNWVSLLSSREEFLPEEHEKLLDDMVSAPTVLIDNPYPVCAFEYLDDDGWSRHGVYGRVIVSYTKNRIRYADTVTLMIGLALKEGSPGMGMSHINKQGMSRISVLPGTTRRVLKYRVHDLITEQLVNNHDEDMDLGTELHLMPFQARDEAGGRFSGTFVWQAPEDAAKDYYDRVPKFDEGIKCW